MVTENAVQSVSIPGQASAEEETYQGNVVLRVETQGRMRQALLFVDELCQTRELRLLRLVGKSRMGLGAEIWLGLREPVELKKMLSGMAGVSRVIAPSHQQEQDGNRPVTVLLVETPHAQEAPGSHAGQTNGGKKNNGTIPTEVPPGSPSTAPAYGYSKRASLPSLAEMLVEAGMLPVEEAIKAHNAARKANVPLSDLLVQDGLVLPNQLAVLAALRGSLTMVDLRSQDIDPSAVIFLPEETARRYTVLPIRLNGGHLTVAMTDPTDIQLIHDLTARTGRTIDPVIATHKNILEHIEVSYHVAQVQLEAPQGEEPNNRRTARLLASPPDRLTVELLRSVPIVRAIDLILRKALQDRASDIHIAGEESRLRVRFRIDGILHDIVDLPLDMHPLIISRLKILAGMNVAERRRSQDGQFTVEIDSRKVDIRVSISNTINGELVVLRLLDKRFTLMGLDQLGMDHQNLEQFRRLLRLPYGMIIVCGPTGSGKSTTMYGSLLQMNRIEQHVISLEDPVEYHITDANQMQVHAEAGITFATQLRSTLRLDPDVILVGEIRDEETATIATQAALTGHLVITSLHANDAASALLRMRDLGVAPYLITSSIAGIVAQRMVRLVCNGCQARRPCTHAEREAYALEMGESYETFVTGAGCNLCAHTGYRERTGVFETLVMSDSLRQLFMEDAPRHQLVEQALKEGMVTLRKTGMQKVKEGITTPYEVMRVLFSLE